MLFSTIRIRLLSSITLEARALDKTLFSHIFFKSIRTVTVTARVSEDFRWQILFFKGFLLIAFSQGTGNPLEV